jgi:hypothetical protein
MMLQTLRPNSFRVDIPKPLGRKACITPRR